MSELFILLILLIIICLFFKDNICKIIRSLGSSINNETFRGLGGHSSGGGLAGSFNISDGGSGSPNMANLSNKSFGSLNGSGDEKIDSVMNVNKNNIDSNADLTYFQNDMIDQAKINENSYDVINQIDKIDYADVKTGMQKCKEKCKGVCLEFGYTGSATCYPKQKRNFDYGTLYKNPMFSYGTNAYKPESKK